MSSDKFAARVRASQAALDRLQAKYDAAEAEYDTVRKRYATARDAHLAQSRICDELAAMVMELDKAVATVKALRDCVPRLPEQLRAPMEAALAAAPSLDDGPAAELREKHRVAFAERAVLRTAACKAEVESIEARRRRVDDCHINQAKYDLERAQNILASLDNQWPDGRHIQVEATGTRGGPAKLPTYAVSASGTTCAIPLRMTTELKAPKCQVDKVQANHVFGEVVGTGVLGIAPQSKAQNASRAAVYSALAVGAGDKERAELAAVEEWLLRGTVRDGYHEVWLTGPAMVSNRAALVSAAMLANPTEAAHRWYDMMCTAYPGLYSGAGKRSADTDAKAKRVRV